MPRLPLRSPSRRHVGVSGLAVAAGVLGWVGAASTWVSISLFGLHLTISGTNAQLDGDIAVGLAIAGLALGVLVSLVGERWRLLALAGIGGVAIAGLAVIGHEAYHLENVDRWLRDIPHFEQFAHALGIDAGAGWGLYLTGAAFGLMLAAAALGAWLELQSRRNAPPSTGITQPVRYDAAGDNANAAT